MSGMSKTEAAHFPFVWVEDAVDWIRSLSSLGIRLGLERMEWMMEALGSPHQRLQFIHVAGTNGKGSTCAMLTSMLLANGYKVGMYTSPYMEKYTERIKYNNKDIPDDTLLELVNQLKPLAEEMGSLSFGLPTTFEVSTALAILYFATVSFPDFVVWETGVGGRLDATNIVTPMVSIITNIGHDHMELLGNTMEQIAAEKAGIMKPSVPVITTVEQPEALEVIRQAAATCKSTLYVINEQFGVELLQAIENKQKFTFFGPFRMMKSLSLTLNGAHQLKNAAAALMALEVLGQHAGIRLEEEVMREGLQQATWPGRLEMVCNRPRILLDGAHNPEGALTLARALCDTYNYDQLHIMIGMSSIKPYSSVLRHILPLANTIIFTEPDFHSKIEAESLRHIAEQVLGDVHEVHHPIIVVEPDWHKALDQLRSMTEFGDLAVVTGTLYLIADVRSFILYRTESEKGW